MYSIFNNPLKLSILCYLLIVMILITTKCKIFFDKNGNIRKFGCNNKSTYFNLPTILYFIAILISFLFQYVNLKNN